MTGATARRLDNALAGIVGLIGAGTVLWSTLWARYGLDFTDEGFYLNFIANPHAYRGSTTEFAFIYHPIFLILGHDIVLLRDFSIIVTVFLANILIYLTLSPRTPAPHNQVEFAGRLGVAALFSPASLLFTWPALSTPSYNSLNMQALLIACIGFALVRNKQSQVDCAPTISAGYVLVGLGGCLAFVAKPPTAAALGVLALWALLISKSKLKGILISLVMAVGFMFIFSILIDGTPEVFLQRLSLGFSYGELADSGHSLRDILRIGNISLGLVGKVNFLLWTSLTAGFTFLSVSRRGFGELATWCAAFLFGGATLLILIGVVRVPPEGYVAPAMLIGLPALGAAVAAGVVLLTEGQGELCQRDAMYALGLAFFPYAFAFGSGNDYWEMGAKAGIFWIAASIMLLKSVHPSATSWRSMVPLALITNCVTVLILGAGFEAPYRQPQPLRLNDRIVRLGKSGHSPIISAATANYIEGLRAIAVTNGFRRGDPVIDLTGAHPTSLFALGALPIGQPWTIGGYPGSVRTAAAALGIVPCDLIVRAWLLTESDGPLSLPLRIVGVPGLTYKAVGALRSPDSPRWQQLLKPTQTVSQGVALCDGARRGAK